MEWLVRNILGESNEIRGRASSPIHRMKTCLRYFNNTGYQKGIGQELRINQSTVSKTVKAVVPSIVSQIDRCIKFPVSNQEITAAKVLWQTKFSFLSAIGAVDCTHVGFEKPQLHGNEYANNLGMSWLPVFFFRRFSFQSSFHVVHFLEECCPPHFFTKYTGIFL